MRRSLAAIFFTGLVVAGCGDGTVFYAEGVDIATRDADFTACSDLALIDYPVRMQTHFTHRSHTPAQQICTDRGACSAIPGTWTGGTSYLLDVNATSRHTAARTCMGSRGYARVSLPICDGDADTDRHAVMPPLSDQTCIRYGDIESLLVVNPGEG